MEFNKYLESLLNNTANGLVLKKLIFDEKGTPIDFKFLDVNPAYLSIFGFNKKDVVGKTFKQVFANIRNYYLDSHLKNIFTKQRFSELIYFENIDKWFNVDTYSPEDGYYISTFTDVSSIKKSELEISRLYEEIAASEEELKAQNEQLAANQQLLEEKNKIIEAVMDASSDIIWYHNLKTGQHVLADNWRKFTGFSESSNNSEVKDVWENLVHPEDLAKGYTDYDDFISGKRKTFELIYRVRRNDGMYRWVHTKGKSFADEDGKPYILAGVHTDIDKLKKQEERLQHMAYHDPLTGLPNRVLLLDRLELAIKLARREKRKVAVMFMDIDDFKKINDGYGHNCGDSILMQLSGRIGSHIREYDSLARMGGDEFAIVFQSFNSNDDIYEFYSRIKECFIEPFDIGPVKASLSCSIGVSIFPEDGETPEDLLKYADTAMYKAKDYGKNNIQFFNDSMKEELLKKLELEKELREALEKNEFKLHYQPQYDAGSGKIRGIEALIRWDSPKLGLLLPDRFIPVSEEIGMIDPIGDWVLKEACKKASEWKKSYGFNGVVSVNISPVQLRNNNFLRSVKNALDGSGLAPADLELEITESIFIKSYGYAEKILSELARLGVGISLDDFGIGYSSLGYLRRLPIRTIKIDKSFISEIIPDSENKERVIVGPMISLAKSLNLEIIAEGVETQEQSDYLTSSGCDCIQGFAACKPVPEDEILKVIQDNKKI